MPDTPEFLTHEAALAFLAQAWIDIIAKEIKSDGESAQDTNLAAVPGLPDLDMAKADVHVPGNVSAMLYYLKAAYDRAYEGQTDLFPRIQGEFSSSFGMKSKVRHGINACFDGFSDFLEGRMDEIRAEALQIMTAADILGVSYTTIFSKGDLNMPLQEL